MLDVLYSFFLFCYHTNTKLVKTYINLIKYLKFLDLFWNLWSLAKSSEHHLQPDTGCWYKYLYYFGLSKILRNMSIDKLVIIVYHTTGQEFIKSIQKYNKHILFIFNNLTLVLIVVMLLDRFLLLCIILRIVNKDKCL